MNKLFLRNFTWVVVILLLTNCRKNNEDANQSVSTLMEATCTSFSAVAEALNNDEVYYAAGGISFKDNETSQEYSLSWTDVLTSDANGYATIQNTDLLTDHADITKYQDHYFAVTNVSVPNVITFQVKNTISAEELKNSMLGFKTIKVAFRSDMTYYIGIFDDMTIDQYNNDKDLLRSFSKKALSAINKTEQQLEGHQFKLTLTKR